jgi:hypothetical protein
MSKIPAALVVKQNPKNKDFYDVYIKGATAFYASVHQPKMKYQAEKMDPSQQKEYTATLFVQQDVADYLMDVMRINKTFFEVGVSKNKLRKVKFPISTQVEEGKHHYDDVQGLWGAQFSLPEYAKSGKRNNVLVVDSNGKPTQELVGNGSVVTVKLSGYRNDEGLLNLRLHTMKVEQLVAYEGGGGGIVDDELGINISADELEAIRERNAIVEEGASDEDEYGSPRKRNSNDSEEDLIPF